MKTRSGLLLLMGCVLCLAANAADLDLGNRAPAPGPRTIIHPSQTIPRLRQGGDTIDDAYVIPGIPFEDIGTTVAFANDYDAECPYTGSVAPDVVYAFTPVASVVVDIDLCGSGFDTKLYVLDANLDLLACNDDYYTVDPCGLYVSKLRAVELDAGHTVYIVIDGYGDSAGDYQLRMISWTGQEVACYVGYPTWASDEWEPHLYESYVDMYNGGCNTQGSNHPFQWLYQDETLTIYGRSGWYYSQGAARRDTDWFRGMCDSGGQIDISIETEYPVYLYRLGNFWDCEQVWIMMSWTVSPCEPVDLTLDVGIYQHFALWVGPTSYMAPDGFIGYEFNYVLGIDGLDEDIPTEPATWGAVKSLYR